MGERYAAIDVDGVDKTFRMPKEHVHTLKERALHPFRRVDVDELHALRGRLVRGPRRASSSASSGATARARARCSSASPGSTAPTAGAICVDGRLSPFIELGVGFNPDLTARDNVIINAIMLGPDARARRASASTR